MDTVNANTTQQINRNDVIHLDDGSYVTASSGQAFVPGTTVAETRNDLNNSPILNFFVGWAMMNQARALDAYDREGHAGYRNTLISNAHKEIGLEFSAGGYLNPFTRYVKQPSSTFLKSLSKKISQKQNRHLAGTAKPGGGYVNSMNDAQSVLDAVHSGSAEFLGTTSQGHQVFRVNNVTGTNVNLGAGITNQQTNVFMIKGTVSPSVVPTNPFWKP